MNIPRRLTNQDAFDGAMLYLLNQGHSCVSASGQARYRGPRGKSAIGALIPDELYVPSMEGKNVRHWLTARAPEYDALRERLGNVAPALLDELQDLHDRIGACMPSLYRHLAVAGAQRIAGNFKLSMRLVLRAATYQYLRGPQIRSTAPTPVILAPSPAVELAASPAAAIAPVVTVAPVVEATPIVQVTSIVEAIPAPDVAPPVAAAPPPTPAPVSLQSKETAQNDLDLFTRGIERAIAAARGQDQPGSR